MLCCFALLSCRVGIDSLCRDGVARGIMVTHNITLGLRNNFSIITSAKIILLNEWRCRDTPCENMKSS